MSRPQRNGLIVAVIHVAIVATLGGKLLVDRAIRPRVWARAAPFDPNLPIRGRYVRIRIEGTMEPAGAISQPSTPVTLTTRADQLRFLRSDAPTGLTAHPALPDPRVTAILDQPLAYFIPEHVPDPSRRSPTEELWVEVTLPAHGAPRPIRLGVKANGAIAPLPIR